MFHKLIDERVSCMSILTEMTVGVYLDLVDRVYHARGGLKGQRGPIKTKTASIIRERMVDDIRSGAVLPPVVLGILSSAEDRLSLNQMVSSDQLMDYMSNGNQEKVSIIDGMQRTTAMLDACNLDSKARERNIRVEFWISEFLNSLVYRMLVLNTGQVPWEVGHQLETVYGQFLRTIKDNLQGEVEIFERDEQRRRASNSQYQGRNIIELLLLFSSRKSELDLKDKIAEDFAR